jgi:hypothetical protein
VYSTCTGALLLCHTVLCHGERLHGIASAASKHGMLLVLHGGRQARVLAALTSSKLHMPVRLALILDTHAALQVAGLESRGGTLVLRGLSDLGRFPQWTMDVAVAQREGQPGVYVAVGTSDNQVQVFAVPGDAGRVRGVLEHCRLLSILIMQRAVQQCMPAAQEAGCGETV